MDSKIAQLDQMVIQGIGKKHSYVVITTSVPQHVINQYYFKYQDLKYCRRQSSVDLCIIKGLKIAQPE